jgi:hypothetical protein
LQKIKKKKKWEIKELYYRKNKFCFTQMSMEKNQHVENLILNQQKVLDNGNNKEN